MDETGGAGSEADGGLGRSPRAPLLSEELGSRYLSVADVARVAGFSRRAVYRAIERRELAAGFVCSRLRIHPEDFIAWMESHPAGAPEQAPRCAERALRSAPAAHGLRRLLLEGAGK